MKRKFLSLILVFAMTVSLLTVGTGAVEPTYGDTAGHWAESSIERWSGHGIIQGSNGLFDPNGQLTCAQLATILAKLLKLPVAKDAGFTDNTADAWYYDAINRCAAAGILNGNGDGTVTPEAPISRERAMVMLARALGIEPIRKPDLTKYTDAAQVSAYAQGYVAALIEAGIVGGVTADELAPQDNINRASTVTILDRAISTYADKAGETVKVDGKGLVLVVAKNVKITGAPEGTKIVVADGATGLTVNGKSVSDDQTYIVPKTEPAKPSSGSSGGYSHSHTIADEWSYDDTYHWHEASCGREAHRSSKGEHTYNEGNVCTVCGQVNPTETVAKIGAKNYATLADAMTYAVAGDTIVLKTDIPEAEQVTVGKKVTLDMDSHTITSAVKQVFTVLDSGDLTITGNGTITGPTGDAAKNFDSYSMIYVTGTNAKLTVLNGTITAGGVGSDGMYGIYVADGGNVILGDADTKAGPTITTWFAAVGENNTTSPANITIYGGEYTAQAAPADSDWWAYFCAPVYASASGDINISGGTFNGYYGISSRYVNVGQNLNISGGTFNGSKSALFADTQTGTACDETRTIAITGGTFSSDPSAYLAVGYKATEDNGTWTVEKMDGYAMIEGLDGWYETLTDAAKAWRESKQVVTSGNTFGANSLGTVDSITWTVSGVVATGDGEGVIGNNGAGQSILGGGYFTPSVTVNSITIKGSNGAKIIKTGDSYLVSAAGQNVVYEDITFVDTVRIDSNPANLTFKNCTFEAGFRMPHSAANGKVTIENCTFTGNESSGYAIFAQGSMASFKVTDSTISNCQRGINVQAGNTAEVTISGNTIENLTGKTENEFTYGSAIQLTSAKTFSVTGNTISDVAVNAFHIYSGCPAVSIEIKDNNISAAYLCWNEANYTNVTSSGNTLNISNAGKCVTKTAEIESTFALN